MKNNLKAIRKALTGLTQIEAAKKMNLNLETYRKWEQGKVQLNSATLKMLADFYGCTIDDILVDEPELKPTEEHTDRGLGRLLFIYEHMNNSGRDALLATAEGLYMSYSVKNNPISDAEGQIKSA